MKYAYPAVFEEAEEGGYLVNFPDIKGCFTDGDDMPDALYMAKDCLEMMLVHYEDEGLEIPLPSDVRKIDTANVVSLVLADTDEWRKEFDCRAVKKNCTIPAWLCNKAEKAGVNFSQVLQDALKEKLGVSEPATETA